MVGALKMGKWLGDRRLTEKYFLGFCTSQQKQISVISSSWKDALNSDLLGKGVSQYIQVPVYGCYREVRQIPVQDPARTLERIWSIGGDNGWYYADMLWRLWGIIDKFQGGVGLRRGRTNRTELNAGDALDFWRVILARRDEKRLLLFAEMKPPGDAWLEWRLDDEISCIRRLPSGPGG